MKRTHLLGAGWFGVIMLASGVVAREAPDARGERREQSLAADGKLVQGAGDTASVADAQGFVVPVGTYRRIVSASSLADALLFELVAPEQVIALSKWGFEQTGEPQRYGAKPLVVSGTDLEAMVALEPDLLLLNHIGPEAPLARLREAGIRVFNLGEMRGVATLRKNIEALAALFGEPARGERLLARFERRLKAVSHGLDPASRERALYVSIYGNALYGGAAETSYHDVLTAAGLIDIAAEKYTHWPHYDPEQLLALDPEILVTHTGAGSAVCAVEGLSRLRACTPGRGRVLEIEGDLIGDPGLRMLDAAEALNALAYPRTE